MVNREALKLHGLRAYELGRLRRAARIAFVVVPVATLCLLESRGREACACAAVALVGLCVWLRWRDRAGFELVANGLPAGGVALLGGMLLDRFGVECSIEGASTYCTLGAALLGGAVGLYIGSRESKREGRVWSFLTVAVIASLGASLGCVRLGFEYTSSVVAGIALGTLAMAARTRK